MKDKILEEMMEREGSKLFNMVLRMIRNREEAEDLFQEIFTAFYQHLDRVKASSRKSYLYRTAYNKTLNQIKKLKRLKTLQLKNNIDLAEKIKPDNEKRNILIRESLNKLKPVEAMLIDLQFYQKMSYQEIAQITGYTVSAIDSRLVRAKRKLREILKEMDIEKVQEDPVSAVL